MRFSSLSYLLTALLLFACSGLAARADTIQTLSPQPAVLAPAAAADGEVTLEFTECSFSGSGGAYSAESWSALFDSLLLQFLRNSGQSPTGLDGRNELSFSLLPLPFSAGEGDSDHRGCIAVDGDDASASLFGAYDTSEDLPPQGTKSVAARVSPVPEPSTLALLGAGLLGVAGAAQRKLYSSRKRAV